MDPINRGSEEYGHDDDGQAPRPRPPRDPLATDLGQHKPVVVRTVRLVAGEFLLTVNPVDGSEMENCPPHERPQPPVKHGAAERAERARAAQPPVPPGPAQPRLPLLERQEEREQLVRLLARGRSVRLTGPSGSGRTVLLDAVADDCADLAPDGVIRLSGYRRTASDLVYDLFAAVYEAPLHRPDREELRRLVHEIGAVVVLDDAEIGGSALDELLDATPECAFVIAATPDIPAPSAHALVEEVVLGGLDRSGGLELLERAVGRVLTEDESNWAGDLWFESEGLPLRFMQAGALLRQRDRLRAGEDAFDDYGVFQEAPADAPFEVGDGHETPLPSLAEGAAPAALLASRLSDSARATLRFAVALGGEVPHQAHLPALVGDTHADAALAELANSALVSPVGSRYRLAAGVQAQLEASGYADTLQESALAAAQHYTWWAGHPSVTPERVCAEADALLAALDVLVPVTTAPADEEDESVSVQLARTAAPAFAAGLNWSAWERGLRLGVEASELADDGGEQAYFHHELGILALCGHQLDRARAELEASVAMRAALADKRGTTAGRRALALVADRSGTLQLTAGRTPAGEEVPDARHDESMSPPGGVVAAYSRTDPSGDTVTVLAHPAGPGSPAAKRQGVAGRLVTGTRRNLVAAGAGALLVAVLGTVVTLGATSDHTNDTPSEKVGVNPSATQGSQDDSLGADKAKKGDDSTPGAVATPTDPGPDGTYGTSDDPTPPATATTGHRPSDEPSGTHTASGKPSKSATATPSKSSTGKPSSSPSKTPSGSQSPSGSKTPSGSPSASPSASTPTAPATSNSASGPVSSSAPASTSAGLPASSVPASTGVATSPSGAVI
ncbi:ATP-binding protein [Streptomyces sp. NPDC005251]|uniref:ATP-binding protein n=1 Tax=Streptomyces sp. NPDC005251 TaxID=3157166 RepID=UPI0033B8E9E0